MDEEIAEHLAKTIVVSCVRNTFLEELHHGKEPISKTGDYSDVKVVSPEGEIHWADVSRISQAEMKKLMKEVVNNVYTFLLNQSDKDFLEAMGRMHPDEWDKPEINEGFIRLSKLMKKKEN